MVSAPKLASDSVGNLCLISFGKLVLLPEAEDPAVERQVDQHETTTRQDHAFQNKSNHNTSHGLAAHRTRHLVLFWRTLQQLPPRLQLTAVSLTQLIPLRDWGGHSSCPGPVKLQAVDFWVVFALPLHDLRWSDRIYTVFPVCRQKRPVQTGMNALDMHCSFIRASYNEAFWTIIRIWPYVA